MTIGKKRCNLWLLITLVGRRQPFMGLTQLVSSLLALSSDQSRARGSKRISLIRHPRQGKEPDISQTTTVSEPQYAEGTAIIIDTRMHYAMNVSRNIERCVFKLLNENKRVEPFREYFKARDRYYSDSDINEVANSKDYRDIVRYIVDEAYGEAYVFVEKNHSGRLRVYAQFRRFDDEAVGQFSSDMPNFTDITNYYRPGEVTFGRIKRD